MTCRTKDNQIQGDLVNFRNILCLRNEYGYFEVEEGEIEAVRDSDMGCVNGILDTAEGSESRSIHEVAATCRVEDTGEHGICLQGYKRGKQFDKSNGDLNQPSLF